MSTKQRTLGDTFLRSSRAVESFLPATQYRSQLSVESSSRVSPAKRLPTNSARIFLDAFAVNSPRRAFLRLPPTRRRSSAPSCDRSASCYRNRRLPSPPVKRNTRTGSCLGGVCERLPRRNITISQTFRDVNEQHGHVIMRRRGGHRGAYRNEPCMRLCGWYAGGKLLPLK